MIVNYILRYYGLIMALLTVSMLSLAWLCWLEAGESKSDVLRGETMISDNQQLAINRSNK